MRGALRLKLNTVLLAALLFAAVFACCFCLSCEVAEAESPLHFEITCNSDGWILSADGVELKRTEGDFFNPSDNENAVSVIFKREMDKKLAEVGLSDYSLSFALPHITSSTSGNATFDYTERIGSFIIKADYAPAISQDIVEALQYRAEDGEFVNYSFAQPSSGGLAFGQNVDVGRYYVRFAVRERFTFDGRVYNVARYGSENFCAVRKATPVAPVIDTVAIEYGTPIEDMERYIPSAEGSWRLADGQMDEWDGALHVRAEDYVIRFNYTPNNKNYETLKDVDVAVRIEPRLLRISVEDMFSLVGEPIKTDVSYTVLTPLAEGDRAEDLGIEFVFDGIDVNTAGEYDLAIKLKNPDYKARSISSGNVFSSGRYIVYATSQKVTAPDGATFEVLSEEGFKDMTLRIGLCENEWWKSLSLSGNNAYRFIFENSAGERVYPKGSFTVTWQEGEFKDATHIGVVLKDGEALAPVTIEKNHITVLGNTDVIAFLIAPTPECRAFGPAMASVIMIALCCALAITLAVLAVVYFKGRRYFK